MFFLNIVVLCEKCKIILVLVLNWSDFPKHSDFEPFVTGKISFNYLFASEKAMLMTMNVNPNKVTRSSKGVMFYFFVLFPTRSVPSAVQVVGHKEGLDVMERADPLFLLIGLPTIPVMLILGKMIRWEDYVLRLWRKYSNKLQILNSIFPGAGTPDS